MSIFLSVFVTGLYLLSNAPSPEAPSTAFNPLDFTTDISQEYQSYIGTRMYNNHYTQYASVNILTPGMGGNADHWLKTDPNNTSHLIIDSDTLPYHLCFGGDRVDHWGWPLENQGYNVFILSSSANDMKLYPLIHHEDLGYFVKDCGAISNFSDVDLTKQIVILYDGFMGSNDIQSTNTSDYTSNEYIYSMFEDAVNRVVAGIAETQYGFLPRINLIGHSRGGLINLRYAYQYPKVVKNLISLGTPYVSSDWANVFVNATKIINSNFNAYDNMLFLPNAYLYSSYLSAVSNDVNSFAIGFEQTYSYFSNSLLNVMTNNAVSQFASELYLLSGQAISTYYWQQFASSLVNAVMSYASNPINLVTLDFLNMNLKLIYNLCNDPGIENVSTLLSNLQSILSNDLTNNSILKSDVAVNLDSQLGYYRGTTNPLYPFTARNTITLGDIANNNYYDNNHCSATNLAHIAHNYETKSPTAINSIITFLNLHGGFHEHNYDYYRYSNAHELYCDCAISVIGEHTYEPHQYDSDYHRFICSECALVGDYEQHNYRFYQQPHLTHNKQCLTCGYQVLEEHYASDYIYLNREMHSVRCACGYQLGTEGHFF